MFVPLLYVDDFMKCIPKETVSYGNPNRVGYFSVTEERFYRPNASQLKIGHYPKPEAFPLDLNADLRTCYRKEFNHFYDEYLDNLLYGISENRSSLLGNFCGRRRRGLRVNAHVVCQMELLQTLMCTPFKQNDNWLILATKYRDTLYLSLENPGEQPWTEKQRQKSSMETMLNHQIYKAYDKPNAKTIPEECSEFNYILSCKINDLTVIYSAPFRGASSTNTKTLTPAAILNLHYFECKLADCRHRRDGLYSPAEGLMWWSESNLKGENSFFLAAVDPDGRVKNLNPISREKLLKDNSAFWSGEICQQFLSTFLAEVLKFMKKVDDYGIIYEFKYVPEMRCVYRNKDSGQRLSFIPEWYRMILEDN